MRLATPVQRISGWDGPVTEVHTPAGVYRAKQVILALSPPLCQRIEFSPALPEARAELQRGNFVGTLDANSIMLGLDQLVRERGLDPAKYISPPNPRYTTGG